MAWYRKPYKIIKSRKDLTQKELADILGVEPPTVNRYLKGGRDVGINKIKIIAEYVGLSLLELILDEINQPMLIQHVKAANKFNDPDRAAEINRFLSIIEDREPKELDILLKSLEARVSTYANEESESEHESIQVKKTTGQQEAVNSR